MLLRALHDDRPPVRDLVVRFEPDLRDRFHDIRCPRCAWQPEASSRWCCACHATPEPPFISCGTIWNTFETLGRCPGCDHQWIWTSCLACGQFSLHDDWYATDDRDHP